MRAPLRSLAFPLVQLLRKGSVLSREACSLIVVVERQVLIDKTSEYLRWKQSCERDIDDDSDVK